MAEEGAAGQAVDHEKALELYERSALQGDPSAQLAYADKLEEGEGLSSPDLERAFVFYERAALNGIAEAQDALGASARKGGVPSCRTPPLSPPPSPSPPQGRCYQLGNGTEKDLDRAFFWHEKAAQAGDADGAFHLASAFDAGEGCAKVKPLTS